MQLKSANTSYLLSLASLLLFVASCAHRFEEDAASAETQAVIGVPVARALTAKTSVETELFSDSKGVQKFCKIAASSLSVLQFDSGKFQVELAGKKACDPANPQSFRGWINSTKVEIPASSYLPELKQVLPNSAIGVSMRYSTSQIFPIGSKFRINEPLYGSNACYLHPSAAALIQSAAIILQKKDPTKKLLLLDCYRPVSVQFKMAALVKDPKWVAQPKPPNFGGHNGGIAVDVTLADAATGKEIDMGSPFDAFDPISEFDPPGLARNFRQLRSLLRESFQSAGFKPYNGEWWHFSISKNVVPLNLPL